MIARYAAAIGVGAVVTFGLLFLMQLLIDRDGGLEERSAFALKDFVRVQREEVIERKEREIEKPPDPLMQPEMPMMTQRTSFTSDIAVSLDQPVISSNMQMDGLGFGVSDGEYLPTVKVAPQYPPRAASRGLEGYVIVEFTVTAQGTTRDIKVAESSSVMFERAAVEAAGRFRYRPRVIDGVAVEVPNVRNKITFVLDE